MHKNPKLDQKNSNTMVSVMFVELYVEKQSQIQQMPNSILRTIILEFSVADLSFNFQIVGFEISRQNNQNKPALDARQPRQPTLETE